MAIALPHTKIYEGIVVQATLLSAAAATGDGEWIDVSGLRTSSIHTILTGTATVLVRGSNEPTRPTNNTHGFTIHTYTATGRGLIHTPCHWIKAYVSAYTDGTATCYFYGVN